MAGSAGLASLRGDLPPAARRGVDSRHYCVSRGDAFVGAGWHKQDDCLMTDYCVLHSMVTCGTHDMTRFINT